MKNPLIKIIKISIVIIIIIFSGIYILGCTKKTEPLLRVGTSVWPGYECLYLARELGYYNNSSIKLVELPSASDVIQAYRNRSIEAAAITMDEALLIAQNDKDTRIILVMDISNGADVVIAKPDVQNLQGLKGRRIGVESTALGAFVITRALENAKMSIKDIKIIPMNASKHEMAFKQGLVDAVVTFEPVKSNLISFGAKVVFDSAQIPGEIVDVMVTRMEILDVHPSSLDALINGWFKALDYLKNNPQDVAKQIAPREGISPEQFLKSLNGIIIPDRTENQRMLGKTDKSLHKNLKKLSKIMQDNNLLNNGPEEIDTLDMLDDQLVNKVKPR